MTDIVAPIFVQSVDAVLPQIAGAVKQGTDIIELRCDQANREVIESLLTCPDLQSKQIIVTIRAKAEGGLFSGSEADRLNLILHACRLKPQYVDIEYDTWRKNPEFVAQAVLLLAKDPADNSGRPKLILSTHDFSSRPPDLRQRMTAMAEISLACIIKAAYQAENLVEALEAFRLYEELPKVVRQPLVIIAMGEAGLITRILAAKYNAAFTFAVPTGNATTAPGQPTITDLLHTYHFKSQMRNSPVYGVMGWPVSHSISPMIHNAGFHAVGFPGVYVPLPIEPEYEGFCATVNALRGLRDLNFRGASVTIPHKAHAARYLESSGGMLDETSARIGVINTLYFPSDGSVGGTNSDWYGAIEAMRAATGWKLTDLAFKRVAVLGAGGAARAMVAGMASLGATVVVYNRALKRAQELAYEFNGKIGHVSAALLDEFSKTNCNVVINCTPAGMSPHVKTTPVDDMSVINSTMVAFDTVYNPRRTRFLDIAAKQGAQTIEGLEMLVRQAVIQFEGFTGKSAPLGVMRIAAEAVLEHR